MRVHYTILSIFVYLKILHNKALKALFKLKELKADGSEFLKTK